MQVTDITRVAEEVTSTAVSAVNDSLVSAAREGEQLATRAAGWFEGMANRMTPRSHSTSRRTVIIVALTVAAGLWLVARRTRRTAGNAADENNVVESFAPADDQSDDARAARQAS